MMELSPDLVAEFGTQRFWIVGVAVALVVGIIANFCTTLVKSLLRVVHAKYPAGAEPYLSKTAISIVSLLCMFGMVAAVIAMARLDAAFVMPSFGRDIVHTRNPAQALFDMMLAAMALFANPVTAFRCSTVAALFLAVMMHVDAPSWPEFRKRYLPTVLYQASFGWILMVATALATATYGCQDVDPQTARASICRYLTDQTIDFIRIRPSH